MGNWQSLLLRYAEGVALWSPSKHQLFFLGGPIILNPWPMFEVSSTSIKQSSNKWRWLGQEHQALKFSGCWSDTKMEWYNAYPSKLIALTLSGSCVSRKTPISGPRRTNLSCHELCLPWKDRCCRASSSSSDAPNRWWAPLLNLKMALSTSSPSEFCHGPWWSDFARLSNWSGHLGQANLDLLIKSRGTFATIGRASLPWDAVIVTLTPRIASWILNLKFKKKLDVSSSNFHSSPP